LIKTFEPTVVPALTRIEGPDFMLLAGLTSFADWIGSNETWFTFGSPKDCEDPSVWWKKRREIAELALDAVGWHRRDPVLGAPRTFESVFPGLVPRPLQTIVAETVQRMDEPCILLLEAPMGEGKTEAAFYAHLELQRRLGHRGLYLALPTKATGNAMFRRTEAFLRGMGCGRPLDLQLLHGATQLNEEFQELRLADIHADQSSPEEGRIRAAEWFTPKKRALLSEYGVGTIDQALLSILPVRHHSVRLWGLANRVVILDEVHAYDAYTGTLLHHLLDWLLAMGSSVVLLSATLPPRFRRELARRVGAELPEVEAPYPRMSIFQRGSARQIAIAADPARHLRIRLVPMTPDPEGIRREISERLEGGGQALALLNTVQRAQDLYRLFLGGEPILRKGVTVGKRLQDGLEIYLFHARFPADLRQVREDQTLESFGPQSRREGRKLLIATQVAEQSLDLDFDILLTDLAPVDLLLQRAGRLWRHTREVRPFKQPCLLVAGLGEAEPPSFGAPLWWGKVYREDLLLRTWCLLKGREALDLPEEIDDLVRVVYEYDERLVVPAFLRDRMAAAVVEGEGLHSAHRTFAHQAVIDLGNWEADRFLQEDEDDPGRHPSLTARTRLGEPSVVAVPLDGGAGFDLSAEPGLDQARAWSRASLSLSRKGVVQRLLQLGVPEGWRRSPLLRHAHAMVLDADGRWVENPSVCLDKELGLCFEAKEVK
jgi:CRISPR-associated endonuclease/helicase Cas3